jgi:hypothetical protein
MHRERLVKTTPNMITAQMRSFAAITKIVSRAPRRMIDLSTAPSVHVPPLKQALQVEQRRMNYLL